MRAVRGHSTKRVLALVGVGWSLGLAATPAAGADVQTVSVVTPGTPARWSAAVGGLMKLFDPFGDEDKAAKLKRMAKEDRFDPGKRLQQHLLEALANRGRVALPLTIPRPAELAPSPLARDRLPETALPGAMLDTSLEWFGLYRKGASDAYRPMMAVSYRVLGPKGDLQRSTRRLYYNVASSERSAGGETIEPADECAWKAFDDLPRDRARLWGCMDAALEKVSERIGDRLAGER
jgi:hypothetical protein